MINGRPGGPNLTGPRFIILVICVVAVLGLLYVLNRELGGALWP